MLWDAKLQHRHPAHANPFIVLVSSLSLVWILGCSTVTLGEAPPGRRAAGLPDLRPTSSDAFETDREQREAALSNYIATAKAALDRFPQGHPDDSALAHILGALKAQYTGRMDFGSVGPMVKARLA